MVVAIDIPGTCFAIIPDAASVSREVLTPLVTAAVDYRYGFIGNKSFDLVTTKHLVGMAGLRQRKQ